MNPDDADPITVDEQLGSPGWTLELGWLIGLALGLAMVLAASHRHARGGDNRTPAPE